jgi:hypothetical protein
MFMLICFGFGYASPLVTHTTHPTLSLNSTAVHYWHSGGSIKKKLSVCGLLADPFEGEQSTLQEPHQLPSLGYIVTVDEYLCH